MTPAFSVPTDADYTELAQSWMNVCALAKEEYDTDIDQSLDTLAVLQQILDNDLVNDDGVLAVGVAMGRVMAKNIPGLDWWVVVDEFGRDLCLRYRATTLRINPVSMISKRVSRKEIPNIAALFDATKAGVEKLAGRTD
jgi:hypothetical protein